MVSLPSHSVTDLGDGPVDPDHPSRLATMHWHSASGYRQVPYRDPRLGASRGAPGPGGPRGRPGGNFRPRGAPGPGGPGGPPGGQNRAPAGPLEWALFGPFSYIICITQGGSRGVPPGCTIWPRGPPGPRGAKKCTFFWVFNNSPSRDSFLGFFGPPGQGPRTGYPGQDRPYGGIGGSTPSSYRACPGTMPSPCAAC